MKLDNAYKIKSELDKKIRARSRLVQSTLLSLISTNTQALLTVNQIFNCLHLLVQEPITIMLYERIDDLFYYRAYFDYDFTQKCRVNELKLKYDGENECSNEPRKVIEKVSSSALIPICPKDDTSKFYVNIFYLSNSHVGSSEIECFVEVISADVKSTEFINWDKLSKAEQFILKVNYYIAACTESLFDIRETLEKYFGQKYIEQMRSKINEVIRHSFGEITRPTYPFTSAELKEFVRTEVKSPFLKKLTAQGRGLESVYRRVSTIEDSLRLIVSTNQVEAVNCPQNITNLFFAVRTFDRDNKRRECFDYNVRFVVNEMQVGDMSKALRSLHQFKKNGGYVREFGEWLNDSSPLFDRKLVDFIDELNAEFWDVLESEADIRVLIKNFYTPISDDCISIFDPMFFTGMCSIRNPFKGTAGLERIIDLNANHISLPQQDSSQYNDCMRLMLFYYLSLLSMPFLQKDQLENFRTRLVMYPVEIYGDVVGALVSFYRVPLMRTEVAKDEEWNYVFRLVSDAYLSAVRDIRREYKNIQSELYAEWLRSGVYQFYEKKFFNLDKTKKVRPTQAGVDFIGESIIKHQLQSYHLSRFIPVPYVLFEPTVHLLEFDEGVKSKFFDFKLKVQVNEYFTKNNSEEEMRKNMYFMDIITECNSAVGQMEETEFHRLRELLVIESTTKH